jgi:NADH-quinone oxidoreductase subunit D
MTIADLGPRERTVSAGTSEGGQELSPRAGMGAKELLREVGAVLRMSEAEAAALADVESDPDEDQTMIINMGPQHPSTHGVLRLMLELQGETVLRCKPVIGYLHTGMEKTGEQLTYMQGGTNVTRMDYLSPLNNELVFSMAVEKLLGIDGDIPERAVWMRMLLSEMNRMSSHLLFLATNGMDIGAVSMMPLRLARARGGAALLPEGHRPADEPQLHPARRTRCRPARRLA